MKKLLLLVAFAGFAFGLTAQVDHTYKMGAGEYYYEFTIPSTDYITGYVNTSGLTYSVDINKLEPCNVAWYLDADSIGGTGDSINVDIKLNYKVFADQSYTTQKTIAADLDNAGDYGAMVADSSYLNPTGQSNWNNVPLTVMDYGRLHQLSITRTSGAGVGKVGDRIKIVKVIIKVWKR